MKFKGAITILTTMILGVLAVAGSQIIDNTKDLSYMKAEEKNMHEDIREIKNDVKKLLERK